MQYTVQLHCTLYHKNQCSVNQKTAREEDLREEWNGDIKGHYSSGQNYVSIIYLNQTSRQDAIYYVDMTIDLSNE